MCFSDWLNFKPLPIRDKHFVTFENLVYAITSKILRVLRQYIEKVCSLESRLVLSLYVLAKTSFSKIAKCSILFRISQCHK